MSQTVMLVNDSEDTRLIFRVALESAGFRVIEAGDGFDGYSLAFKEVPDLILTEHPAYVPGGTTLVDALGANERTGRIRFLVATSRIVFENDPWLLRSNCAGYLTKPVKPTVLLRTVSALVGSLQHATPLPASPPEPG